MSTRAVSKATDLRRLIGQSCASLVFAQAVRLQLSNVAARNCRTAGVQGAPKLLDVINYVERVDPVTSPAAMSGRHYREACY